MERSENLRPRIYRPGEHSISREAVDRDALRVIYRLYRAGHLAYVVGGGVRDLLLGRTPKDYDLGTDASPSRLRRLFRNSRIIGRRFKIVHVWFPKNKVMEVTTFRGSEKAKAGSDSKILKRDNTFGTPAEDAIRRDLTINGLFYDVASNSVIDYVDGMDDLKAGVIRTIGDPARRFTEDPVRIIRAIRHAARVDFSIEPQTWNAILQLREGLGLCSESRLCEEFMRDLRGGASAKAIDLMRKTGVLAVLSPGLHQRLIGDAEHGTLPDLWGQTMSILTRADQLQREGADLPDSILLAALFFPITLFQASQRSGEGRGPHDWERVVTHEIKPMSRELGITRRMTDGYASLLCNMWRLYTSNPRSFRRLVQKQMFRELVLLLEILEDSGVVQFEVDWRSNITGSPPPKRKRKPRSRRRRGPRKKPEDPS